MRGNWRASRLLLLTLALVVALGAAVTTRPAAAQTPAPTGATGASQPLPPAPAPVPAPVAKLTIPASSVTGAVVTLDASASLGDIVRVRWDFGDGTRAFAGLKTTHTYQRPGLYTVTVDVVDVQSRSALASSVIRIGDTGGAAGGDTGRQYGYRAATNSYGAVGTEPARSGPSYLAGCGYVLGALACPATTVTVPYPTGCYAGCGYAPPAPCAYGCGYTLPAPCVAGCGYRLPVAPVYTGCIVLGCGALPYPYFPPTPLCLGCSFTPTPATPICYWSLPTPTRLCW